MIGIIGFGRFGKLMAGYLAKDYRVVVYNRSDNAARITEIGAVPGDLARTAGQRVVILSVPISRMRDTLMEIAPLLSPDAVVVDVCSVKVYPVQWMKALLPESVSILATHPMFGPDSAAASLLDRKIVLCRGRIAPERYEKIKSYLASKGLMVIETTPDEHDRQIALSLCLTHFIGRSLDAFGAGELIIDTEGYKRLLHILGVVTHDTWQLFVDMNRYNPYAEKHRRGFMAAMEEIEERLKAEG
jgi:prephenate dehydrogenase